MNDAQFALKMAVASFDTSRGADSYDIRSRADNYLAWLKLNRTPPVDETTADEKKTIHEQVQAQVRADQGYKEAAQFLLRELSKLGLVTAFDWCRANLYERAVSMNLLDRLLTEGVEFPTLSYTEATS